ncbi:hypothetical protein Micbo1qcDRAFT_122093 [Microdochium bolleyi]|uniref:Xylanolytic transcriptional activator regulatory domain-containing protein n=1 Tax=Microdochium bolleyi TaxID=196109 RepID=A0A136IX56_9PEZI|nr:hypothetical protein Micbo1qcDRAFT_122093 [Microdochium bolleyi]
MGSGETVAEPPPKNPWDVSEIAYQRLLALFTSHQGDADKFRLPSRPTVSRYVASWARSFHPHLPVLHLPTNDFDSKSSILLLTIAAVGSFYVFEHSNGYPMLFFSRSIIWEALQARYHKSSRHLLRSVPNFAKVSSRSNDTPAESADDPPMSAEPCDMELLQAMLILVMTMTWLDRPLAHEATALASQLAQLTREALAKAKSKPDLTSWHTWALEEERVRTIYSAYFTLNLVTISLNVVPLIPSSEIILPLPCSESEFKAPTADSWLAIKRPDTQPGQMTFDQCVKHLLRGHSLPPRSPPTEYGHYLLMQSLLIQVYFERQSSSCLLSPSSTIPPSTIAVYDAAMTAWQPRRDPAIDSALDPSALNGPLAFNSTAMLRLAHVHLTADIQAHSSLAERDPAILVRAFHRDKNTLDLHAPHLHQGLMHAINALRIPIRVGVAFVASGRTGHWSVQHAISNFSCALLLTQWLDKVHELVVSSISSGSSGSGGDGILAGLSPEQRYLLSTVERLVEETHLEASLGARDDYPRRIRRVAGAALRLWAETCKGAQVYEIVHVAGATLAMAADALELEEREGPPIE